MQCKVHKTSLFSRSYSTNLSKQIVVKESERLDKIISAEFGLSRKLATKLVLSDRVKDEGLPGKKVSILSLLTSVTL
jgi:RNA-binding protein YlmH